LKTPGRSKESQIFVDQKKFIRFEYLRVFRREIIGGSLLIGIIRSNEEVLMITAKTQR